MAIYLNGRTRFDPWIYTAPAVRDRDIWIQRSRGPIFVSTASLTTPSYSYLLLRGSRCPGAFPLLTLFQQLNVLKEGTLFELWHFSRGREDAKRTRSLKPMCTGWLIFVPLALRYPFPNFVQHREI